MVKKLKKIGRVLHHSKSARPLLICEVNGYVERHTRIFNEEVGEIGHLAEVFGPVEHPYGKIEVDAKYEEYRGPLFVIEE
ncbi:MAG: hypothetical protein GWO20_19915 [Candidatus Korarchaeota archaeon]|nr:hypothetical protein [Candidatus Korarchaeota archaeon]